jgi:hypothetical protein
LKRSELYADSWAKSIEGESLQSHHPHEQFWKLTYERSSIRFRENAPQTPEDVADTCGLSGGAVTVPMEATPCSAPNIERYWGATLAQICVELKSLD